VTLYKPRVYASWNPTISYYILLFSYYFLLFFLLLLREHGLLEIDENGKQKPRGKSSRAAQLCSGFQSGRAALPQCRPGSLSRARSACLLPISGAVERRSRDSALGYFPAHARSVCTGCGRAVQLRCRAGFFPTREARPVVSTGSR
jgi:hypothetical protein